MRKLDEQATAFARERQERGIATLNGIFETGYRNKYGVPQPQRVDRRVAFERVPVMREVISAARRVLRRGPLEG